MKSILIFFLLSIAVLAVVTAQRCAGRPRNPSCSGSKSEGRRGLGCGARNMWYFNTASRQCRQLRYRGCGGNSNRWCNRNHCQRSCLPQV